MILTVEQRDEMLARLSEEQQSYLLDQMTRGRRTIFANAMAKEKGAHVPADAEPEDIEILLNEWIYKGYIDAGKVSPELKCECGRSLRYQHHVQHKSSGQVMKFGIEHLKEHLGIDASIVAVIIKGFDAVDYELDEMLLKIENGWQIDPELIQADMTPEIMVPLSLGLPLLDKQIRKLKQRAAQKLQPAAAERPIIVPQPVKPAITDIFSWQEDAAAAAQKVDDFELPYELQGPTRKFLESRVKSARVICELLIENHRAPSARFITNKPKMFLPVCRYIESLKGIQLQSANSDDRYYSF
ncbi:DUF3895 domain-containing protein [Paenibacillus albus]|uniref:DUF3895 domain-containing protein n=1 Tax=Paenibacillus albus TaxID=2495582 RepID=A0A3Q8XA32_9BACL|nr:DUF3895 domain-containing protein [Paenibacillus albus]